MDNTTQLLISACKIDDPLSNLKRRCINKLLGVNKTNKFKWWWNK